MASDFQANVDAIERIPAQLALIDARELAELREQFVAVLGHDLRNSLASVAAGIQLLRKRQDPAVFAMMESSVEHMSGLIDDVMDMVRGRLGGGLALSRTPLQMAPLISQVVSELQSAFPERVIDVAFALPQPVHADSGRIAQLLSNLLDNALTYGDAGQPVHVRAETDTTMLTLSVTNAGKPIPPHAIARLFQPFTRGSAEGHKPGLGLGLYIASEIARAHDGRIDVTSNPEETRFTLSMPLSAKDEAVRPLTQAS